MGWFRRISVKGSCRTQSDHKIEINGKSAYFERYSNVTFDILWSLMAFPASCRFALVSRKELRTSWADSSEQELQPSVRRSQLKFASESINYVCQTVRQTRTNAIQKIKVPLSSRKTVDTIVVIVARRPNIASMDIQQQQRKTQAQAGRSISPIRPRMRLKDNPLWFWWKLMPM